ncbi:MAG: type II toxin-antitoxin system VapC family toxin [Balneolaceae bacterium]
MVLDTSAVIAILQDEPEAPRFISMIEKASVLRISAATLIETGIVMHARYGDAGDIEVDQFIQHLKVTVTPVTLDQAEIAREAYREYGKGNHPAGLNYGDCFSYALAISTQEELLFKGEDFAKTDIKSF